MSSGGMDWAYRMMALHNLDPLGVAVVLHLGWRDAPNQRTDKGIARALHQHASSVRKATAKLAFLGLIVRRSGIWVSLETVRIVEETADAPRPDAEFADARGVPLSGPCHSVARGVPLSGTQRGHSVAPKRKEKRREGAQVRTASRRQHPDGCGGSPSRIVNGRREYRGPDGSFYRRPDDDREAVAFDAWIATAGRVEGAEKKVVS